MNDTLMGHDECAAQKQSLSILNPNLDQPRASHVTVVASLPPHSGRNATHTTSRRRRQSRTRSGARDSVRRRSMTTLSLGTGRRLWKRSTQANQRRLVCRESCCTYNRDPLRSLAGGANGTNGGFDTSSSGARAGDSDVCFFFPRIRFTAPFRACEI